MGTFSLDNCPAKLNFLYIESNGEFYQFDTKFAGNIDSETCLWSCFNSSLAQLDSFYPPVFVVFIDHCRRTMLTNWPVSLVASSCQSNNLSSFNRDPFLLPIPNRITVLYYLLCKSYLVVFLIQIQKHLCSRKK